MCNWKHLTANLEKSIVNLRLSCSSRRKKQAQKWHLDSSACQIWGWLQRRIYWGSSSQRHHKSYILKPIFRHFWNERLVSTYKVPNLWEGKVFPRTDTWSGARTGLGCIAIRFSEKNSGWALSSVAGRRLGEAGGSGGWVPFERGCEFYNICPSEKHHLSESNWPPDFCTGGATKNQVWSYWCHLMDKTIESKIAFSLAALWPNDRILHLSRKTEAENTILLAGFYEITAWELHFWGYVCISVSMYEREWERGDILKYLGGDRT